MYNGAKMTKIHGVWNNIYFWGNGFRDSMTALKWWDFWNNWKNYKKENHIVFFDLLISDTTPYLVSTYGSIFIHPMNFTAIIYNFGESEIGELIKICNDVAKYCDSNFRLEIEEGEWHRV